MSVLQPVRGLVVFFMAAVAAIAFSVRAGAIELTGRSKLGAAINQKPKRAQDSEVIRARAAGRTPGCGECGDAVPAKARKTPGRRAARSAKKLPCHPPGYLDPSVTRDFKAALTDMRRAGITTRVTSTWRSSKDQASMRKCSLSSRCRSVHGLYRALPSGQSAHEGGFAVDVAGVATGRPGAKRLTRRGRNIVRIMRKHGFNWRYGLSDPVHFEADPRKHGYRSLKHAIIRNQTRCQAGLIAKRARPPAKAANTRIVHQEGTSKGVRDASSPKANGLRPASHVTREIGGIAGSLKTRRRDRT